MKRIGILGGSYNPPHEGHKRIGNAAKKELGLDEVWFWVSYNIFKDPAIYAPLNDRTAMTHLLPHDTPGLKAVDIEKDFCDTMTATSLTTLQTLYPNNRFIWIFGDDNFASFHTWDREKFQVDGQTVPDWQYIMNNFSIAVMQRPGYRAKAKNSLAAAYGKNLFITDPKRLAIDGNGWTFIDNSETPESSTEIKQNLLAKEHNIPGLPPDIENYIYERGLYQTRPEFNNAAQPAAPAKNAVPFATFLLLASTANLVKAIGRNNDAFDSDALLGHAAASWDKSYAKGDFLKKDDAPSEIADCLISLYWLASPQGISLADKGHETQQSVTEWCDTHYPERNIELRMKDYIEELTEVCVCEGLEKHRLINLLRLVFEDPATDDLNAAFVKNYETLESCAKEIGQQLHALLDDKMGINRTRSMDESAARLAKKKQIMQGEPRYDI